MDIHFVLITTAQETPTLGISRRSTAHRSKIQCLTGPYLPTPSVPSPCMPQRYEVFHMPARPVFAPRHCNAMKKLFNLLSPLLRFPSASSDRCLLSTEPWPFCCPSSHGSLQMAARPPLSGRPAVQGWRTNTTKKVVSPRLTEAHPTRNERKKEGKRTKKPNTDGVSCCYLPMER